MPSVGRLHTSHYLIIFFSNEELKSFTPLIRKPQASLSLSLSLYYRLTPMAFLMIK